MQAGVPFNSARLFKFSGSYYGIFKNRFNTQASGNTRRNKGAAPDDNPQRFIGLKQAFLSEGKKPVRIMGARVGKDAVYLFLERIYDRTAAEGLRGEYIYIDREHAVKLPEGRYFIADLIGCEAVGLDNQRLGTLKEVLQPGANDVYIIQKPDGSELLVPVVEAFIKDIDIQARKIIIDASMLQEEEIRD